MAMGDSFCDMFALSKAKLVTVKGFDEVFLWFVVRPGAAGPERLTEFMASCMSNSLMKQNSNIQEQ